MRRIIIFISLALIVPNIYAQSFLWARNARGTDNEFSRGVSTDNIGNSYVTGCFHGADVIFGTTTLTNTGGFDTYFNPCTDIFIAKYDAIGNVSWAKSYGVFNGMEEANSITADHDGNTYITGWYTSAPFILGTCTLAVHGLWDAFVAKFDPSGNVLWAKEISGNSDDVGMNIAVSDSGNVYVGGYFYSSNINFGNGITLTGGGNKGFVAKYDSLGNTKWAKKIGNDVLSGVDVDNVGNVYVTGKYNGPITIGTFPLTNSGSSDVYIVKLSPSGVPLWAKKGGGSLAEFAIDVAVDNIGNVSATGYYRSSNMKFESTNLPLVGVSSADNTDIYVVKYDNAGTLLWAKCGGSDSLDQPTGIDTDNLGNVFIDGYFQSSVITFGDSSLINAGSNPMSDLLIASYDNSGTLVWLKRVGQAYMEESSGLVIDNSNNLYFSGNFNGYYLTIGTTILTNGGQVDLFLVKMGNVAGIDDVQTEINSISIFPNPSNGDYSININSNVQSVADVKIFSMTGQLIQSKKINLFQGTNLEKVDLTNSSKGMYLLEITQNKQVLHGKLILE